MGRQTVGDTCNLNTFSFQGWPWKKSKFSFFVFFYHGRARFIVSLSQSLCVAKLQQNHGLCSQEPQGTDAGSAAPSLPRTYSGALPLIFHGLIRLSIASVVPTPTPTPF